MVSAPQLACQHSQPATPGHQLQHLPSRAHPSHVPLLVHKCLVADAHPEVLGVCEVVDRLGELHAAKTRRLDHHVILRPDAAFGGLFQQADL